MTANDDNEEVKLTKGQLRSLLNCIKIDPMIDNRIYKYQDDVSKHFDKILYNAYGGYIVLGFLAVIMFFGVLEFFTATNFYQQEVILLGIFIYLAVWLGVVILTFLRQEVLIWLVPDLLKVLIKLIIISIILGITYSISVLKFTEIVFTKLAITSIIMEISRINGFGDLQPIISFTYITTMSGVITYLFIKSVLLYLNSTHARWQFFKPGIITYLTVFLSIGMPLLINSINLHSPELPLSARLGSEVSMGLFCIGITFIIFNIIFILESYPASKKYNMMILPLFKLKQSLEIGANTETAPVQANIISNLYSKMGLFMANIKQKLGFGVGDGSEKDLASSVKEGSQNPELSYRKANMDDLPRIVELLAEDELGKTREVASKDLDSRYVEAFKKIDSDQNQYLMIALKGGEVVGTCHLTIMPSLTFTGSTRMQIEAVRVAQEYRGQKIGKWMMKSAIEYAKNNQVSIVQLTTNKQRERSKKFYERLGFEASHEGMKMRV